MSLSLYIPGNLVREDALLISARDARSELVVDCLFASMMGQGTRSRAWRIDRVSHCEVYVRPRFHPCEVSYYLIEQVQQIA